MSGARILACDDDPLFRKTLGLLLRDFGTATFAQNADEAIQLLTRSRFDLLLLDVQMRTPNEGIEALGRIRALDSDLSIVMVSGRKDFSIVRAALRAGAMDYIVKDFEPDEFKLTIERVLNQRALERSAQKKSFETMRAARTVRLVGETTGIQNVRRLIEKFRASAANVVITGETGTGKEIVARLLRKQDGRGQFEPFVAIDSATLHAQTAESLLFGHEKGAFTGAENVKRGLFEEADGGTIFFDEVANLPLAIQAKLLRVLQEKEIVRLGSVRVIPLEFRVVAATNRPLEDLVARGEFLPDLWQRLNVLPISIPPLRERKEDLPLLIDHFLKEKTRNEVQITEEAKQALQWYDWPGNVREVSAFLDYSLALIDDRQIDVADLHPKVLDVKAPASADKTGSIPNFYDQVARFEGTLLREAYARFDGNISKMALGLGMDRSHLYGKLKSHSIR